MLKQAKMSEFPHLTLEMTLNLNELVDLGLFCLNMPGTISFTRRSSLQI